MYMVYVGGLLLQQLIDSFRSIYPADLDCKGVSVEGG